MIPDKATLLVSLYVTPGLEFRLAKEISGPFIRQFDPIDRLTEYDFHMQLTGSKDPGQVRHILARRKDYAKLLADEITELIMKSMEQRDTINGYPIEADKP